MSTNSFSRQYLTLYRTSLPRPLRTSPQSILIMPSSLHASPFRISTRKPRRLFPMLSMICTATVSLLATYIYAIVSLKPYTVNPKNGKPAGMISKETYDIVMANAEALDSAIIYDRDFSYNLYVPKSISCFSSLMSIAALASRHSRGRTFSKSMAELLSDRNTC